MRTGWYFNNLTYLPSARSLWKNNPLGFTNDFVGTDGRQWNTSCDTPQTGRNGCRSYVKARVIEPYKVRGVWHYKWVTKPVFNNIVKFTVPKPPAKPAVVMPDKYLKACINLQMDKPRGADIPLTVAEKVVVIDCQGTSIHDIRGLERFTKLEYLNVHDNQISNLTPLKGPKNLTELDLNGNGISDLTPLAGLSRLLSLDASFNNITDVSALSSLSKLDWLSLENNAVKNVAPLQNLTELLGLSLSKNRVVDVTPLAKLVKLESLHLDSNQIARVAPLATLPVLKRLHLMDNPIVDRESLDALIARGVEVRFA